MKIKRWPLLLIHGKGLILALAKMDFVHITSKDYKIYEMSTSHDLEQVKTNRERIRRNYCEDLLLSCLDVLGFFTP